MKNQYKINKESKVGELYKCPSCGTEFVKKHYQQAFCKSKPKTVCKDKYWNKVTPHKRNNTTRISPASARYMANRERIREENFNPDDYEHPHSSDALGQWND